MSNCDGNLTSNTRDEEEASDGLSQLTLVRISVLASRIPVPNLTHFCRSTKYWLSTNALNWTLDDREQCALARTGWSADTRPRAIFFLALDSAYFRCSASKDAIDCYYSCNEFHAIVLHWNNTHLLLCIRASTLTNWWVRDFLHLSIFFFISDLATGEVLLINMSSFRAWARNKSSADRQPIHRTSRLGQSEASDAHSCSATKFRMSLHSALHDGFPHRQWCYLRTPNRAVYSYNKNLPYTQSIAMTSATHRLGDMRSSVYWGHWKERHLHKRKHNDRQWLSCCNRPEHHQAD